MPAKRLLTTFLLTFPTLALAADRAPSGRYEQDGPHTGVTWRIDHFGLSRFMARFIGAKAGLDWNRVHPTQSALSVEIDPRLVRTDVPFPKVEDFDAKIATAWLSG